MLLQVALFYSFHYLYISHLLYGHLGCFHVLAIVDSGAYEHRGACI